MKYAKERKEAVLRKMLPPSNRSIQEIAAEEGISEATPYLWRIKGSISPQKRPFTAYYGPSANSTVGGALNFDWCGFVATRSPCGELKTEIQELRWPSEFPPQPFPLKRLA